MRTEYHSFQGLTACITRRYPRGRGVVTNVAVSLLLITYYLELLLSNQEG